MTIKGSAEQEKQVKFLEMVREMLDESGVKYILTFKFPDDGDTCINGCVMNASTPEMLRFVEMIEEAVTEVHEKKMK